MIDEIPEKEPKYKFKLPDFVSKHTLGRYQPQLNWMDFSQEYVIYIDVKRIINWCIELQKLGWNMSFDQVFSHVASHEYLHHLLLTKIGKYENECFDNKFGVVNHNPKYVYSGIKFEGDPPYILPKRHIYTKLINSIRNKVRNMKNKIETVNLICSIAIAIGFLIMILPTIIHMVQ